MQDGQLQPATPAPFVRSLGVLGVLFLTLSVTTPASSVFVFLPDMIGIAGTGAIWAFLIAALVCVATAFIYAELSSAWPVAGGEYVMVARTMGPFAGFVMLGVNVFNNLIFLPVAGLGISAVLSAVIPGLPTVPVALVVVAACTLVGLFDIRINATITGCFLLLEVLALVAVVWLGFGDAIRSPSDFLAAPVAPGAAGLAPTGMASIGVATSIAIFALNGYGAAVYFGEEMREAPARIARTIILALVITLALEGLPLLALLIAAPDLAATFASDNPFGDSVARLGGEGLAKWVAVGVALAIVNALIAWVLACARFFYGTGRDRSWGRPLDGWLTTLHPRFGSPWLGTLLIGAAGMALCFLPKASLEVWSGTGLVAIYAGIAVAVMIGRRTGASAHARYRMPLYPLWPLITIAALVYIAWTNWLDVETGRPALIATVAQIAVAASYYWLVLRRRGEWTVQVPD
ncbi:APC family permease [Sphingomonas sp.]|jgi:amino acid transporter|uniref:APC family permease n=1 Tax=Sphingomonas sp. TaxID=28214 RepID=UPI002D80A48C|nr:APC family permease [Sphingomonas sp.]HEU0044744.1 APC family permease [Sphingomonas sp.]